MSYIDEFINGWNSHTSENGDRKRYTFSQSRTKRQARSAILPWHTTSHH